MSKQITSLDIWPKKKNADAVIKVKYDYGIGFDSWGVLTANGILIKYSDVSK